jgi:PAS domain S-box-containing protein
MSAVTSERALDLAPDPRSASVARDAIRELISECGQDQWLDAAMLAVSELVTNAVLHARTAIKLRASCGEVLRVEIADDNPAWPSQREYGAQATTGRGMGLVAALTQDHGVTTLQSGGKFVWFVISDAVAAEEPDGLQTWDELTDLGPSAPAHGMGVHLVQLPATLWLAAVQHHDALLRELTLLRNANGAAGDDLAAADAARASLQEAAAQALAAGQAAGRARSPLPANHPAPLQAVPPALNVDVLVERADAVKFALLQDVLDEAERLASAGQMLARAGLPEVIALRDWTCEQVIAQLNGQPATAWPGTDSERFTAMPEGEQWSIDWDTRRITESDRGAVAADESNRIIAISRPLADTLGWKPADLVGRRVVAIVPPQFREAHVAGFTRHLTTGEAHALGVELDLPVLRADGTQVLCSFMIEAHRTAAGRNVYVSWVTPKTARPNDVFAAEDARRGVDERTRMARSRAIGSE